MLSKHFFGNGHSLNIVLFGSGFNGCGNQSARNPAVSWRGQKRGMEITLELITSNCHSCSTPYLLTLIIKDNKTLKSKFFVLTKIKSIKEVVNSNLLILISCSSSSRFTPLHNISTGRKCFYKVHLRGGDWVAKGKSPFITRFSLTNNSELRLFLGKQKSKISLSKILRSSRWELKISQALILERKGEKIF